MSQRGKLNHNSTQSTCNYVRSWHNVVLCWWSLTLHTWTLMITASILHISIEIIYTFYHQTRYSYDKKCVMLFLILTVSFLQKYIYLRDNECNILHLKPKQGLDSCLWTLSVPQNSQFSSKATLLENSLLLEHMMSADKNSSIFLCPMEAIVFILLIS